MGGAADTLKELADAIDEALDRLAAGYESQRRFASNASHELRTPLAVQRLLTEVAMDNPKTGEGLRRLGAQLLRTNERNEKLIVGLLVLAESDRGLPGKVPVRLDELAGSVLDAHRELAGKHEVSLRSSLAERQVPGDPLLLERLISNLVTNAIIYNQPGGWVDVVVAGEPGPALTVHNTGPAIPAEAVSSLFEPFRRLTADRTNHSGGAGLGLSIVRSITTAHGGTVRAWPRTQRRTDHRDQPARETVAPEHARAGALDRAPFVTCVQYASGVGGGTRLTNKYDGWVRQSPAPGSRRERDGFRCAPFRAGATRTGCRD
jgi:signal transduction histidine kinase